MSKKFRICLKTYDHEVLDRSAKQLAETIKQTGAEISGPVPLPTEISRYCVIRSPHVNKDSREQFEMRVHKRLIDVYNSNANTIEELRKLELPSGIKIEIKQF